MNDSAKVSEAIGCLFRLMGIVRVVYVDDQFAPAPVEEVIGFLKNMAQEEKDGLPKELAGVHFEDSEEVWEAELREIWADLPDERKEQVHSAIVEQTTDEIRKEYKSLTVLPRQNWGICWKVWFRKSISSCPSKSGKVGKRLCCWKQGR